MSSCVEFDLNPEDNSRLQALCGPYNGNLDVIEKTHHVEIHQRGFHIQITGKRGKTLEVKALLESLYQSLDPAKPLTEEMIYMHIKDAEVKNKKFINLKHTHMQLRPKGNNQAIYLSNIEQNDINFGIGPAGTGKTFLAVAKAVEALENDEVDRIIFVRPAVEAGEKLGFLPGDLEEKVLPYLRPLYDSLATLIGTERTTKLTADNIIEVAPIAYMRGRTLNNAYIILDEAQNTTVEQMKMFLTRIGFGSTAIITGDITQIDLQRGVESGLAHATRILQGIPGISFSYFQATDAVRHPLVQAVIQAYEKKGQ